jgi:hypothetical protein
MTKSVQADGKFDNLPTAHCFISKSALGSNFKTASGAALRALLSDKRLKGRRLKKFTITFTLLDGNALADLV